MWYVTTPCVGKRASRFIATSFWELRSREMRCHMTKRSLTPHITDTLSVETQQVYAMNLELEAAHTDLSN